MPKLQAHSQQSSVNPRNRAERQSIKLTEFCTLRLRGGIPNWKDSGEACNWPSKAEHDQKQ